MDPNTQPPADPTVPAAILPSQQPTPIPAPQAPATQAATQAAIPAAADVVKATPVLIYPGRLLVNERPGLLIWGKDNIIRLLYADNQELVFQCAPTDMAVFSYWTDHTTIKLKNGQAYMIGFNADWMRLNLASNLTGAGALGAGMVPGVGSALQTGGLLANLGYEVQMFKLDSKNDSAWWVTAMANFGVRTKRVTMVKTAAYVTLGLLGAFILAVIIIAIAQSN